MPDDQLLAAIRREIAESPFVGEGHKKICARLRLRGIHTSRKRVLRLTREAGLLAPTPKVRKRAARLHDGRITTDTPDELWATDPTEAWTRHHGRCAVFALVDHCTGEAWVDAAPRMDRFAAADLLREAITDRFGSVEAGAAAGLKLRHDGGSCFRSDHYQAEIDHLGIDRSPAFHYEPKPTASSRSSSRPSRSRCCGSSASTRSSSCAPASASSPTTTTTTGCSNATATAPHARPATRSVNPP
jgi:putative transposase